MSGPTYAYIHIDRCASNNSGIEQPSARAAAATRPPASKRLPASATSADTNNSVIIWVEIIWHDN
jgi:hypothetical protein